MAFRHPQRRGPIRPVGKDQSPWVPCPSVPAGQKLAILSSCHAAACGDVCFGPPEIEWPSGCLMHRQEDVVAREARKQGGADGTEWRTEKGTESGGGELLLDGGASLDRLQLEHAVEPGLEYAGSGYGGESGWSDQQSGRPDQPPWGPDFESLVAPQH